ncbi:MAG: sugar porter family MFS transporter [Streptococcaceae bacterium]|jgi:SP family arabinose:H+ symporter-like MFS transporter|nr:sugar porter family MFS transporter [Streptococcaceae bacterium]
MNSQNSETQEEIKNISLQKRKATSYAIMIVIAIAFGGFLFGYDQGVIAGALPFIGQVFHLTPSMTGFVSGAVPLGAMMGCAFVGILADKFGRRPVLVVASILFMISGVMSGLTISVEMLIIARLIGGMAVGMASTIVPLLIAEFAPQKIRGAMVGGYQLAIVIGMFATYLINYAIASTHTQTWGEHTGWRIMLFMAMVPGVIFFILMFIVPESPRFLIKVGKGEKVPGILKKFYVGATNSEVADEVESIKVSIADESKGSYKQLFAKGVRVTLLIAVLMGIFQQLSGVNAINYYAPTIFKDAGLGTNAALFQSVFIALVKVIFVVVFMVLVDRLGRKRLLLIGSVGMGVVMGLLSWAFTHNPMTVAMDIFIIAMVAMFMVFFEIGMGAGTWVLISELFPTQIRARAASIASFALWAATYAVTQAFPIMVANLGAVATFAVFSIFGFGMFIFIKFAIRETNGKSLEEIQEEVESR